MALYTMFVQGEDCIIIENDAGNCFDRILTNVEALAFMRLDLAVGAVGFYMNFLEAAQHHIILKGGPSK